MKISELIRRAMIGAQIALASITPVVAQGSFPGTSAQPVARGATGRTSLIQNNLIFGNGTNPVGFIAPGTNGRCLIDNGTIWAPGFCVTTSGAAATGTTGHAVPFLDGANIFSALQTVSLNASALPAAQVGALLRLAQADGVSARLQIDSFGAPGIHSCVRADGTNASPSALSAADEICSFNSFGYNGAGYVGASAALRSYAAEAWSSGHQGTYWRFATTANGSTTLADRIGIENDGGITVPPSVTGGSPGMGAINASVGYFVGGVQLATIYSLSSSFSLPSGVLTLQPAAASMLGGVNSIAQTAHQWVQYIDTAGLPHLAQPSFGDLAAGTASCAQLPALTGNVTTTAGTCGPTAIAASAVTYAMIQNVAAARLWGNPTGSAAPGSEISLGTTLSFVGSALQTGAGTGDVAWSANSFANTIQPAAVTFAKFQNLAALSIFGNCTTAAATGGNVTGTANQVLRVNGAGTSCGFGAIDLSQAAAVGSSQLALGNGGTGQSTAAAARASSGLNVDQFTGHGDSAYTILATDRTVGTNAAFTASRTWTLPAANAVNPGQEIVVADFQGTVTGTNTLVISRAGSDTVNGGTAVTITAANGAYLFKSDGVSKWTAQALGAAAGGGVSSVTCFGTTITTSGTCVTAAVKSDQIAATSNTVAVTPSVQQFHPSAVKAWVSFAGSTTNGAQTLNASYNVTSVTRNSLGSYTVAFTTPFSTANYVCNATNGVTGTNGMGQISYSPNAPTTSAIYVSFVTISSGNFAGLDPFAGLIVCYGTE